MAVAAELSHGYTVSKLLQFERNDGGSKGKQAAAIIANVEKLVSDGEPQVGTRIDGLLQRYETISAAVSDMLQ